MDNRLFYRRMAASQAATSNSRDLDHRPVFAANSQASVRR
jgi:hypothetical protein